MNRLLLVSIAGLLALPATAPAQTASPAFNVRTYGAKGDGSTDDSAAFNKAFAACYAAGGGRVYVPSNSAAYHLHTNLVLDPSHFPSIQNNCGLVGDGLPNWPGPTGNEAAWTRSGSWIACDDQTTSSACIDFWGSGFVEGVNFWHNEPTPSSNAGVAWTPTVFPWTIAFRQNFSHARDVMIANAPYGIDFEYQPNSNIAGTYSYMDNIWGGCFNTCFRFHDVNDTMHVSNIHVRHLWNVGNPNLTTYLETHLIGWDVEYLDNLMGEGLEFYETWKALAFADGTAAYANGTITHAAENLTLTNVQFNQDVQGIAIQNGTTNLSLSITNYVAQSDTDTNLAAPYFFDLSSDNADVILSAGRFTATGNALVALGNGKGGRLQVNGLTVQAPYPGGSVSGYGYFHTGSAAFYLAKNSTLDIPEGTQRILPAAGAGPAIACAAPVNNQSPGSNCGTVLSTAPTQTPTSP